MTAVSTCNGGCTPTDIGDQMTGPVPFSSLPADLTSKIGANSENSAPFRSPPAPSCDDSLESDRGIRACAECGAGFDLTHPRKRFCWNSPGPRWTPVGATAPRRAELVCRQCRRTWTRPAQTGRLPHSCPDCRGTTARTFTPAPNQKEKSRDISERLLDSSSVQPTPRLRPASGRWPRRFRRSALRTPSAPRSAYVEPPKRHGRPHSRA